MAEAVVIRTRVPQSERSVAVYDGSAERMADLYESTSFEAVHAGILDLLPPVGSSVLDVGAGSGRDAAALAARGYDVTAVEPSAGLRQEALTRHPATDIRWIDDALPRLPKVESRPFGLILVSAVWMHLAAKDRSLAIRRLAEILAPDGHLVISIRLGPDDPARAIKQVDVPALESDASRLGLVLLRRVENDDALGRSSVRWLALAFGRPPIHP